MVMVIGKNFQLCHQFHHWVFSFFPLWLMCESKKYMDLISNWWYGNFIIFEPFSSCNHKECADLQFFLEQRAVILWVQDPAERDATLAHEALKKKGYRHASIIVEIACASSPDHLIAVRQAYCFLYYSSLEEDIINYYSRHPFLTQVSLWLGSNVNVVEIASENAVYFFYLTSSIV